MDTPNRPTTQQNDRQQQRGDRNGVSERDGSGGYGADVTSSGRDQYSASDRAEADRGVQESGQRGETQQTRGREPSDQQRDDRDIDVDSDLNRDVGMRGRDTGRDTGRDMGRGDSRAMR